MILIKGTLLVKPGQFNAAVAAIAELQEATRQRVGVQIYEFFTNDRSHEIIAIEAHQDSETMLSHIAESSFDRLFTAVDVDTIEVFGDPSPTLRTTLEGFGTVSFYGTVAPVNP